MIKEKLENVGYDLSDISFVEIDGFDEACVGISSSDRLVYDYDKMLDVLLNRDKMSLEEAKEYIEYNVFNSLSYMSGAPIVILKF